MIKLIKAQLCYMKYQIHKSIISVFALLLLVVFKEFNPTNLICFILFMQFVFFTYLSETKENRNYKYVQLNLSNREIATVRIILSLIGFTIIYLLGVLSYLIFDIPTDGFHDTILELILFGGVGLLAFYSYLLLSDIFSLFKNKSEYIIFSIVSGGIIFVFIILLLITVRNTYNTSVNSSITYISLIYVASLFLALSSLKTFYLRESHLGY